VAELDDHVAMSGTDPVEELGPVGELAPALVDAVGGAKPVRLMRVQMATWFFIGCFVAALNAVMYPDSRSGSVTIDLNVVISFTVIGFGFGLVWWKGTKKLVGRSRSERPSFKWYVIVFLLYLAVLILMESFAPSLLSYLKWETEAWVAWVVLVASLAGAAASMVAFARLVRIPVPGNARHLRHLGGIAGR
jgi:uncharacterized integral membrane protein